MTDMPKPARRGFAAMSAEKRLAIARLGGKAVPNEKRAFSVDGDLAAWAGQKGGERAGGRRRPCLTANPNSRFGDRED